MTDTKLNAYRAKRNFAVTGEPQGETIPSDRRHLKFSVQHHEARSDHFDLRLELDGTAVSWAVPKGPSFSTSDKRLAMRVEDHPIDYMSFEGIIPKGEYGGGTVMLWDEGEWIPKSDPKTGLKNGSLKFRLEGSRLKGDWALVRMKSEEGEPWLLIKEHDKFAKKTAGISRFTKGIRSGKSMREIAKSGQSNPFSSAQPMLAELCETLPKGKGWLYELKYDGHRTLSFSEGGKTVLKTRNGVDCTDRFSAAAKAVTAALNGRAAVLDGEMTAVGKDGIPDFSALQASLRGGSAKNLCYVLFDLLALDGIDLRNRPLTERKEKLKALLHDAPPLLSYSEHTDKMTARGAEAIRRRGMEGIVIKRAVSPYCAGKNGDWKKLKFRKTEEFVIGGYLAADDGAIRSLLLGYYENEKLVFAGCAGTGLSEHDKRELKDLLRAGKSFDALPKKYKDAVCVKPELIAQVEFAEFTSSKLLRQASFKGLRTDKAPFEVTNPSQDTEKNASQAAPPSAKTSKKRAAPKNAANDSKNNANDSFKNGSKNSVLGIEITHPEKLMFPKDGITKYALAEYYALVSERMLPYLKDRVLSLVCCPSGIEEEKFFRKHLEGEFKGVRTLPDDDGKEEFYVSNAKGVISLVQYNAVEFHIRGIRKSSARPDVMVFDLDPDEGLALTDVRRGALELKKVLDSLGLVSFLKTSGGKGYHILVPFRESASAEAFRLFSKQTAQLMEHSFPKLFTATMKKSLRTGKIFLDWQRNSPGATSAAPYSVRARSNAPVSMPIGWDELSNVAPDGVTLRSALKFLEQPDPWADFFKVQKTQRLSI